MCTRNKWITDNDYLDTRNKDINRLIGHYISLSNNLKEMGVDSEDDSNNMNPDVHNKRMEIYSLQEKLFENNNENLQLLMKQKQDIERKHNSTTINKNIIDHQNRSIGGTENLLKMRDNRLNHSVNKNKKLHKKYTIILVALIVLFFIQIGLLIILKDKKNIISNK